MEMESEMETALVRNGDDECPHCEGMGKLNRPGVPDCPYCRGTGLLQSPFPDSSPDKSAIPHVYLS